MGHGVRKENISRFSDAYTWRGVGGTWKRVESFPLIWAGEQVWDKLMVWRGRGHAGSQLPRGGGGEYQLRRNSWFPAETKKNCFLWVQKTLQVGLERWFWCKYSGLYLHSAGCLRSCSGGVRFPRPVYDKVRKWPPKNQAKPILWNQRPSEEAGTGSATF